MLITRQTLNQALMLDRKGTCVSVGMLMLNIKAICSRSSFFAWLTIKLVTISCFLFFMLYVFFMCYTLLAQH